MNEIECNRALLTTFNIFVNCLSIVYHNEKIVYNLSFNQIFDNNNVAV